MINITLLKNYIPYYYYIVSIFCFIIVMLKIEGLYLEKVILFILCCLTIYTGYCISKNKE